MQPSVLSTNSTVHALPQESATFGKPGFIQEGRRFSRPARSNMALAAVLLSCPTLVVAFIALLVAGSPITEALLIAYGLQVLAFCVVFALGLALKTNESGA